MRWILMALVTLGGSIPLVAAEPPLVEKYLHSGQLARGEQVLESALAASPGDDQVRFGLAVLQLVRGIERLGQGLYEYGVMENNNIPLLRIPVPKNPDPTVITHAGFRRMVDGFRSDLATVEATLAEIKDREVSLPLRLADVRLDFIGEGTSNQRLFDILKSLMGPDFRLSPDNSDFLVRFDRGDVAWLRAYCHLLMAFADLQMAGDSDDNFYRWTGQVFARPKRVVENRWSSPGFKIKEPARLGHFRRHILMVCELNRETWAFIRAETDNDHEWLPNPRQTGVLRMPVTDEMIDAWLAMVTEVESLFMGKKCFPVFVCQFISPSTKKPLNLQKFLDNPPEDLDWDRIQREGVREQYLDTAHPDVDVMAFLRFSRAFQNSLAVGYAVWFN